MRTLTLLLGVTLRPQTAGRSPKLYRWAVGKSQSSSLSLSFLPIRLFSPKQNDDFDAEEVW